MRGIGRPYRSASSRAVAGRIAPSRCRCSSALGSVVDVEIRGHDVTQVHRLRPGVEVGRPRALLPERVGRGVLHAAERHVQVQAGGRPVDLDDADLRAGRELVRARQRRGADAGGQPVRRVVDRRDPRVEVGDLEHGHDRAEHLVAHQRVVGGDVGDHGRPERQPLGVAPPATTRPPRETAPDTAPTSLASWASLTTGPIVVPGVAARRPTTTLSAALASASMNASRTPGVQYTREVAVHACPVSPKPPAATIGGRRGDVGVVQHEVAVLAAHLQLHPRAPGVHDVGELHARPRSSR